MPLACGECPPDEVCDNGVCRTGQCAPLPLWAIGGAADGFVRLGDLALIIRAANRLEVVDVSNETAPKLLSQVALLANTTAVAAKGEYAYLARHGGSFAIVDLSKPDAPEVAGEASAPGSLETLLVRDSFLFALGSHTLGIYGLTNPAQPVLVDSVSVPGGGGNGLAVEGGFAYLSQFKSAGLVIVNITDPGNAFVVGELGELGKCKGIAASGPHVWVGCKQHGIWTLDVTNPAEPLVVTLNEMQGDWVIDMQFHEGLLWGATALGLFRAEPDEAGFLEIEVFTGNPFESDSHVTLQKDRLWSLGYDYGLRSYDISQPLQPELVGEFDTGAQLNAVVLSGQYAYAASDSFNGSLMVYDVSDPGGAAVVSSIALGWPASSIALDFPTFFVSGHLAGGVAVVDVTDPTEPQPPFYWEEGMCDELALTNNGQVLVCPVNGLLRTYDVSQPQSPQHLSTVDCEAGVIRGLALQDSLALAATKNGLTLVSIEDPASPVEVAFVPFADATDVAVEASTAVVLNQYGAMRAFNVAIPSAPVELFSLELPSDSLGNSIYDAVALKDGFAYAGFFCSWYAVDVLADQTIYEHTEALFPIVPQDVQVSKGRLFSAGAGGLMAVDVSGCWQP